VRDWGPVMSFQIRLALKTALFPAKAQPFSLPQPSFVTLNQCPLGGLPATGRGPHLGYSMDPMPATNGAKVRTIGTNRARTTVLPPYLA
jgi:hypothetical protein